MGGHQNYLDLVGVGDLEDQNFQVLVVSESVEGVEDHQMN